MTPTSTDIDQLVRFIAARGRIDEAEARQLIREVVDFFSEPLDDYVRRRHLELQRDGISNERIYQLLAEEACHRPYAVARPSERQIRRMIYGG